MKLIEISNIEFDTINKILDEITFAIIFNDFYRPKFYEFKEENAQILKDQQFSSFEEYKNFIIPKILFELINTKWSPNNYNENKLKIWLIFEKNIPLISIADGCLDNLIQEIFKKYDFIPIDVPENEWVTDSENDENSFEENDEYEDEEENTSVGTI